MAYRSSTSANGNGTTATGTAPAGLQAGDRLYAVVSYDSGTGTITPPANWVSIGQLTNPAGSPDGHAFNIYEIKSTSGSESYSFTLSIGADWVVQVAAFTGRHSTDAAIIQSSNSTASNTTPITIGLSGLTATAQSDILIATALDQTAAADTWGFSQASGYTERQDVSPGAWNTAGIQTQDNVAGGATGTINVTATRSSGAGNAGWLGFVVSIPASPAIGGTSKQIATKKRKTRRTNTSDFTGFGAFSALLSAAGLFDKDLVTVASASGPITHDTSGALVGQGSAIAGTAAHIAVHGTSGALVGQGSTITGSAARTRAHPSTGALVGQGSAITGAAQHNTPHPTSGALIGQGSEIVGAASRSAGAVTHDTSGALTGQGSTIVGVSARFRQFDTSGALLGQGSIVAGAAARFRSFSASGVLIGQGSVIAGTAAHIAVHGTTGSLIGQGSELSGAATRFRSHATSGNLTGQGSVIDGAAVRIPPGGITHDTSGVLVGSGSEISGLATNGQVIVSGGGVSFHRKTYSPKDIRESVEKQRKPRPKLTLKKPKEQEKQLDKQQDEQEQKNAVIRYKNSRSIDRYEQHYEQMLMAYLERVEAQLEEDAIIRIIAELL